MLGLNRSYATSTSATSNYFGFDLAYDRTNASGIGSYAVAQFNGNIAGSTWKTAGDPEIRRYDFSYDRLNRITAANFNQFTSGVFSKAAGLDFSVSNLSYDLNGNIQAMWQMGWKINGSTHIDRLSYSYTQGGISNRLQQVLDASVDQTSTLGDFKYNPSLKNGTDYAYDGNGNMISDVNKRINSMSYNHLNLPSTISLAQGSIAYTYDAGGNKLEKLVTESGQPQKRTQYYGGIVYQDNVMQFISHEEGRIRWKPSNASFQFDYFLKDHLGNVRMVITEEQQTDAYPAASMETSNSALENSIYSRINQTRVARPNSYPTDNFITPNNNVARTNGATQRVGPGIVLKVMAGDRFNFRVSSWWRMATAWTNTTASPLSDILGILSPLAAGLSGGKVIGSELQSSAAFSTQVSNFLSSRPVSGTRPRAFVNWVLFDEQFRLVGSSSGSEQVSTINGQSTVNVHTRTNMPISKSGYLYIYVSNETTTVDVFFDNLQVTHIRGQILEETHYYPFGLTMAGISSKALNNSPQNRYKFNDGTEQENKEFSDGSGLELYATEFRRYDPQIGRFHQIDPLGEWTEGWSLYSFAFNNPISFNDPLGLTADTTTLPEVILTGGPPPPPKCLHCGISPVVPGSTNVSPLSGGSIDFAHENKIPRGEDITRWEDWVYNLNKFNLLANAVNSLSIYITGEDTYGVKNDNYGAAAQALSAIPITRLATVPVTAAKSIWSATSKSTGVRNAFLHWKKHGKEFPELFNSKQYVEFARNFLRNSPEGTLIKVRPNGDVLKYHPGTNTFGVMNSDGVPKTLFRPIDGMEYWLKQ